MDLRRLALCIGLACPVRAQHAPPVDVFGVSRDVKSVLDSMARESFEKRVEVAGCVTRYAITHDTLLVAGIGPGNVDHTDSTHVYSNGPICPLGVPSVHSHLLPHIEALPSAIDSASARRSGIWALILAVNDSTWRLIIYGGVP